MTEINETVIDDRVYEISYILDDKLSEQEAVSKAESIKSAIATLGGSFIGEESPYLRELAYEMIRVQNNTNIRFNSGYFGWIKWSGEGQAIKKLDHDLGLDETVVRFLIVKTVKENTVFTKRVAPVKLEDLKDNETDDQIDTTVSPELEEVRDESKTETIN